MRFLLQKTLELGTSDHVAGVTKDALLHMGQRSPYRGGQELLQLIRAAAGAALQDGDHSTVERLEDAMAYATNAILRPDLEAKYNLLDGTARRNRDLMSRISSIALDFSLDLIDEYLRAHPAADGQAVRAHLASSRRATDNLEEIEGAPAHYRLLRGPRESNAWWCDVLKNRIDTHSMLNEDHEPPIGLNGASLHDLVAIVQSRQRRRTLRELAVTVLNPHSLERDLQRSLQENVWIFGGDYLPDLASRRLLAGAEFDLPLLRPDGTLHIVELKRANIKIVSMHRGRLVPNAEVHRAVGQVMNYMVDLDEQRGRILAATGVEVRRAGATVVIGHDSFDDSVDARESEGVLRALNSHLTRVEVITYRQLLESAERSLQLSDRT